MREHMLKWLTVDTLEPLKHWIRGVNLVIELPPRERPSSYESDGLIF